MKHSLYALMAFCAFGILSCRKSNTNLTIKEFDANSIQTYISQNGITGMVRDTSGGDTTGIYYKVITAGTGAAITNPNKVSLVYTVSSFDGGFVNTDSTMNHAHSFPAYFTPAGLQLSIINLVKRKGGKIRVLIPSRLAYGINGTKITSYVPVATVTGGTTTTQTIKGNQCLDYTISVINDDVVYQGVTVNKTSAYDDVCIQSYMAANGLTGYTKITSGSYTGLYYKIQQVGTGTDLIGPNSTVGIQFTGTLFTGLIFDQANPDDGTAGSTFTLSDEQPIGLQGALPFVTAGAKLSVIMPSFLGMGIDASSSSLSTFTLPAFSCLRYDINVISVTN